MGMGIAFRPLMERTERCSVKELVEAEGGRIVSDEGPNGKDLERLIASIDLDLSKEPELLRFLRQLAGENNERENQKDSRPLWT